MKKESRLPGVLTGLFAAAFLLSSCMVFKILRDAKTEKQTFDRLAEMIDTIPSELQNQKNKESAAPLPESGAGWETEPVEEAKASPYASLKESNPDFFGWISIEDTVINYPVMYTPQDPEYYLHRDFDGASSQSGVPFLAASCYEGCGNYLIYGHHMKNGSMFASLVSYAKREYWETHPIIRFDTMDDSGEYEVVGAFYSQVYGQEAQNVFRYYDYTDISQRDAFEAYVQQVKDAVLYDTGVNVQYGDQLLTLSTCSYHTDDGRFVVVARKVQPPQAG